MRGSSDVCVLAQPLGMSMVVVLQACPFCVKCGRAVGCGVCCCCQLQVDNVCSNVSMISAATVVAG
jgi:hypothetical protein